MRQDAEGEPVSLGQVNVRQEMARAHFVVRRLERRYGKDAVRAAYSRFSNQESAAA